MHGDAGHVPEPLRLARVGPFREGRPAGRRTGSVAPSYRKQAVMAGRILNRRDLRKQADQAEARESPQDSEAAGTEGGADDESPRPARKPAKAKAPAAKPRKPKVVPRMRAR